MFLIVENPINLLKKHKEKIFKVNWFKSNVIQSKNEVDEFLAISVSLSTQNVKEDKNDDVVGDACWVLDDAVSNQENGSDILETVAGQKESNTGSFNGVSEDWFNFLVNVA